MEGHCCVIGDVTDDYSRPYRLSMSTIPTLHLLSYKVKILSVDKDSLHLLTHALLSITLKLLQDDPTHRQDTFYCFTETSSEYTLLLNEELYKELLHKLHSFNEIRVADAIWRPVTIAVGAFGSLTGISKIAASVISPLADQDLSVFCLSTNQEDYVMLKDTDLSSALELLSKRFRLICDSNEPCDIKMVSSIVDSHTVDCVNNNGFPGKNPSGTNNSLSRPIVHPYTCSPDKLYICNVLPSKLSTITQPLLQLMFFSESNFFCFSVIGDRNISLIIDSRCVTRFPSDCVYSNDVLWRIFTIGSGPLGFDECGIVAQIATPLGDQEISTFYISTYDRDHVLVSDASLTKALKVLNEFEKHQLSIT